MVRMTMEQALSNPTVRAAIEAAQRGDPPVLTPGAVFAFEALGKPVAQGSMTAYPNPRAGRIDPRTGKREPATIMAHTPGLPEWRRTVRRAAAQAMRGRAPVAAHRPLLLGCEFRFDRPRQGKPGSNMALDFPTLGHDQDKLIRAVRDALTGVIYADDGQVIGACIEHEGRLCGLPDFKRWTLRGEFPGVTVRMCLVATAQRALFAT